MPVGRQFVLNIQTTGQKQKLHLNAPLEKQASVFEGCSDWNSGVVVFLTAYQLLSCIGTLV